MIDPEYTTNDLDFLKLHIDYVLYVRETVIINNYIILK